MVGDILGVLFWALLLFVLWYCWFDLKRDIRTPRRTKVISFFITALITIAVISTVIDFLEVPLPWGG